MWLDLVCNGVVVIMGLVTAFIIWRIEMIRKTSQSKTKWAKTVALISGIAWLLLYVSLNAGWQTKPFFQTPNIFLLVLLVFPYVGYLRLGLCLQLDKKGKTITPSIVDLDQVVNDEGPDSWYVKYEYLGEFRGKRKVQPTMEILSAQYSHASENADEQEGAIAAALPNAVVRYLTNRPNIHRFEYDEQQGKQLFWSIPKTKGTKLKINWKFLGLSLLVGFFAVVIISGLQAWSHRNDLVVDSRIFWQASSLELEPGQCVRLVPSGSVSISETEGYDGNISPAGWETLCTPDESGVCAMTKAPYGALVARIADKDPFVLDHPIKVSDVDGGYLWFSVNDNEGRFDDNSGVFRVKYTILDRPCD